MRPEEIRERIDDRIARVERDRAIDPADLGPDERVGLCRPLYKDCLAVATWYLVLGDVDEARTWFEEAGEHVLVAARTCETHPDAVERNRATNVSKYYAHAVRCSVLSGSDERRRETAAEVLALDESRRAFRSEHGAEPASFDECRLLAALVAGDDETAADSRERVEATRDDERFDTYYSTVPEGHTGPLLDAAAAIVADDAEGVRTALEAMLAAHSASVDDRDYFEAVVDHTAAALLVLAWERGLDVAVDSEFLPDALETYR